MDVLPLDSIRIQPTRLGGYTLFINNWAIWTFDSFDHALEWLEA